MDDIHELFKETIGEFMENGLEVELDVELGYNKNDYRNKATDKILPMVMDWQNRPLEPIYAVVFLDAIHYHVRCKGQVVKKAVYIDIGSMQMVVKTYWRCGLARTRLRSIGRRC